MGRLEHIRNQNGFFLGKHYGVGLGYGVYKVERHSADFFIKALCGYSGIPTLLLCCLSLFCDSLVILRTP